MADSPSKPGVPPSALQEDESQLSSLIYDMSRQVQGAMENMLKMISEIDHNSAGIMEDIEKSRESALDQKRALDEEKEQFQKAAYTVIGMLNRERGIVDVDWDTYKPHVHTINK